MSKINFHGQLPKYWVMKKLEEIGKIFNGNSINAKLKQEKYLNLEEGIPYIATKDISYKNIINYNNGISIPFKEKSNFKLASKNTILICAEGGSAGRKIGFTSQEVCFGNKLFAFSSNESVESKYVYYFYFSTRFQKDFKNQMTGIIGGVSMKKFKNLSIPLPPQHQQQQIVIKLDSIFAAIASTKANAEQNLVNAKELFDSYLQSTFENIGEDWIEKNLEELCTKITDGVHKKPNYTSEGIPFIKINNLTKDDGISFKNVSYISKKDHELFCIKVRPEKGDILITKDGTIGIVRIVETEIEFSIFVSVAIIKPIDKKASPYLKYVLISPLIQNQIKPKGAALKHLYLKDLRRFIIPIPPFKEQQRIVKKLNDFSIKTKKLESIYQQKINDLEELKKSTLLKAFNGEL